MADPLAIMRAALQDSLDTISSPRTTFDLKAQALRDLEQRLASCMRDGSGSSQHYFLALQYTFECNVPSRLLPWVMNSTSALESLASRGILDDEKQAQALALSSQLLQALSLIQGIALLHPPTKEYLGRSCSLQILIDLLLASRHLSSSGNQSQQESPTKSKGGSTPDLPLTSVVLDTLICVLVDLPSALRNFEDCGGVQGVVKILKRAGTPREVRMKCLEFLYFYLMDETPPGVEVAIKQQPVADSTSPPTVSSTPAKKPSIASTPRRPMSRYGSSTFAFSSDSSETGSSRASSRSTSGSSFTSVTSTTSSFSSTSSNAPNSTAPSTCKSVPTSPKKMPQKLASLPVIPGTPARVKAQPKSLLMLKRDVDFVPSSPGDMDIPAVQRRSGHARTKSTPVIIQRTGSEGEQQAGLTIRKSAIRTIAEKKEILGTMLGNVDALVESVIKAGIWGLG